MTDNNGPAGRQPDDPPGAAPPRKQPYREVTVAAVVFGLLLGALMNAAITYAGLKIGFTIVGSAIAAVLGFGVLRGLLRRGSILEVNIAQTVASAVNTPNSGVIFTVPVLFLLGYRLHWARADFWLITLACMAGAILGGAFIIPLRKQMIDIERLRFPSATGVAVILRSPGAGAARARVLVAGALLAMIVYLPAGLPAIRVEAEVERLDQLFAEGRISHQDRQRTRAIQRWITGEVALDGSLIERGRLVQESLRREAAGEDVTQVESRRQELAAETAIFSDELALAVYEVSQGDRPVAQLRDRRLGWAERGLWGYSNLQWRLPAEPDPHQAPRDLDGDGQPDQPLTVRVDRARDGRPDRVLDDDRIDLGRWLGLPDQVRLVFAIAPFALGAGFITGRAGLMVLAGGILATFFLNPLAWQWGWMPENVRAHEAPLYAHAAFNQPLGIGLLLGGALMGVLFAAPAIRAAFQSLAGAGKTRGGSDELGLKVLAVAVLAALALLYLAADFVGNKPINSQDPVSGEAVSEHVEPVRWQGYSLAFATGETRHVWQTEWTPDQRDAYLAARGARPGLLARLNPHLQALIIALAGAAWIWFAGIIIAQCTGMTDWSPISGMALLTVVLVLLLAGTGAVVGAVLIGAALCVAITCAADMMADLKTGYLVGALPRRQQVLELLATGLGPVISMFTLLLIVQVNLQTVGIPIGPGTETVAPQAQALQAVIRGVQGGEMPYALYGLGALLGALLGLGAFPSLGVLVGLSVYLPFLYISTYGIGCLINLAAVRIKGTQWSEDWGVPAAAGLIVGEAILALAINTLVLMRG